MERDGRGENFVKRNRLNIVARSVAAISIVAAGIATVEKSGYFDPLDSRLESANHLVLKDLYNSYEQLIDKLPEVENAEAAPLPPTLVYPSTNPWIPNRECNPPADELIDFTPHSKTLYVGDLLTFLVDACLPAGGTDSPVRLVEEDPVSDDTLDSELVYIFMESVRLIFYLDCEDGGWGLPNKLVGYSGYSQDVGGGAELAVELGSSTNSYDNRGAETGVAQISCLDVACTSESGSGAGSQDGSAAGSCSVGGIAELTDVQALPQESTQSSDNDLTPFEIGGAAAVAGALTAASAVLYSRRNRSTR